MGCLYMEILQSESIKILKKWQGNGVYIKLSGVIESFNTIHKLNVYTSNDHICLCDKISNSKTNIEKGQIYKVTINRYKSILKFFLDSDITVTIVN